MAVGVDNVVEIVRAGVLRANVASMNSSFVGICCLITSVFVDKEAFMLGIVVVFDIVVVVSFDDTAKVDVNPCTHASPFWSLSLLYAFIEKSLLISLVKNCVCFCFDMYRNSDESTNGAPGDFRILR